MAYVITDACKGCKDTACVTVCPAECIHPLPDDPAFAETEQLYIDPEMCIDCGLCASECPVNAIHQEDDLPNELRKFIQINVDYFAKQAQV